MNANYKQFIELNRLLSHTIMYEFVKEQKFFGRFLWDVERMKGRNSRYKDCDNAKDVVKKFYNAYEEFLRNRQCNNVLDMVKHISNYEIFYGYIPPDGFSSVFFLEKIFTVIKDVLEYETFIFFKGKLMTFEEAFNLCENLKKKG